MEPANPPLAVSHTPFKKHHPDSTAHVVCDDYREEVKHLRKSLQDAEAQIRKDAATINVQAAMLANYKDTIDGIESDLTDIFSGKVPLD